MKPRVWTDISLPADALALLHDGADVVERGTLDTLPGAAIALIGGRPVDGAFLDDAGPGLLLVVRHGAGYDNIDVAAATARGILVANVPDAPTESTAEHTVALLLAVAKRIAEHDRLLRAEDTAFGRPDLVSTDLRAQVLGVVGCGRIGRRVMDICLLGLQMQVLAYDPYLRDVALPTGVQRADTLDDLLAGADFVTLHVPLSGATRHLIGARELRQMKRGAYLINASRGPVVDEPALIQALQEGHLAGAGLDVFDPEPPLPANPLRRLPNVVLTPHVASNTPQTRQRLSLDAVEQVLFLARRERPTALVDPTAWPGRAATWVGRAAATG